MHLHSVSPLRERLDNHFLVLFSPLLHHRLGVREYHRIDVIDDVFLLSALVVKGDTMKCERPKSSPNIEFGAAGDT